MKKIFITSIISLIFLLSLTSCAKNSTPHKRYLTINGQKIEIEIADTSAKRRQGLSNRQSLPPNQGMLFIFDNYARTNFWMKDMRFPIDIIWIRDDQIIGIEKNIPIPDSQILKRYTPNRPINYVLEVNAGYSDKNNIKIGDRIKNLDLI